MADDTPPTPGRHKGPAPAASSSAAGTPPPGHGLRRATTVGVITDDATLRRTRTSSPALDSMRPLRRSSNFSEYSFGEARDLLNPQPRDPDGSDEQLQGESSSLASLSLAFALLPALAGVLFKNGSAVVTDVMLLGLAGVFLHWSVTQPWSWYYSAQEVRVKQQAVIDSVIDDESDVEPTQQSPSHASPLEHVPEEDETQHEPQPESQDGRDLNRPNALQQSALQELYLYEILALASCFALPLAGAYLLHAIRSQLSRPSEGLVSNYNLTIFLLISELRVMSHMLRLLQSRTLHLQKVVQNGPSMTRPAGNSHQMDAMLSRLEQIESRLSNEEASFSQQARSDQSKDKKESSIARDVRNSIQPELDALNRAVRRYEKKATLLQFQTESRFAGVDTRLEDAIALAASAAKNSASHSNVLLWAIESLTSLVLLPFKTMLKILLLPLSTLLALTSKNKTKAPPAKSSRSGRGGKTAVQPRYSGDRVPSRVAKR